jgi:hypothetical protein
MKKTLVLFFSLLLAGPWSNASIRSSLKSLCEKHIIAHEPPSRIDAGTLLRLAQLAGQSRDQTDFLERLVTEYRRVGGKLYWLTRKSSPSKNEQNYRLALQNYLSNLGLELHMYLAETQAELKQKIDDALTDYEYLEVH